MYSDDPDTSFLNELNERLCNEFDAGVHTDPTAATWLLDAHRRIDEVIEKAQTSEPLSSPTLVRGRHLRAAVCSRLLRICTSPDEKQALAEQGLDDETEAMRILRELVLQGHAEWRPVLADVIHRTLVLVELHPQLSFALATRAESIFASSLRLFGPQEPSVVSTAARLASTFGRAALALADDAEACKEAGEAVLGSLRWTQVAVDRLATTPHATQGDTASELMVCLWNSLMAANAVWIEVPDDAYRVLELASKRWEQLAELAEAPAGRSLSDASLDEVRGMLIAVIIQRLSATEDALTPADGETPDLAGITLLRRLLHVLPESLWSRNDRAEEIERRLEGGIHHRDIQKALQAGLDSFEIRCLTGLTRALGSWCVNDPERAVAAGDDGAIGSWILMLTLRMTPTPPVGHLSVAIQKLNRGSGAPNVPLAVIEQDLATYLPGGEASDAGAMPLEVAMTAATIDAVLQVMIDTADTDQWLARVEAAVRNHCMPLAEHQLIEAIQYAWYALMYATDEPERLSHDATHRLLDLATDAAVRFAELGERRPVLEMVRAELLFILTNSDAAWLAALGTAATAVVEHASDPGLGPEDGPLFDNRDLAQALRYVGITDIYSEMQDASALGVDIAIVRLTALAQDRASDPDIRRLSETFAAELAAVRARVRGAPGSADSGPRLATVRPMLYLLECLEVEDESFEHDQHLINGALERQLGNMSRLRGLTRDAADHLEVLTRPWAARRLGLDDAQLLRLGRLVRDIVDHTDPRAADLALQVAVNLASQLTRPESHEDYSALAEDVGERFLACALTDPHATEAAGEFMWMRACAALNMGAVTGVEYERRCHLAVGAHLLAVARSDIDLAAQTAYTVAEFFRCARDAAAARRWYSAYDEWRLAGGLADASFVELRAAIAKDRRMLDASEFWL